MFEYKTIKITKYIHDGFRIEYLSDSGNSRFIYIDPYKIPAKEPKADVILISHEHYDHLDPDSINKIVMSETQVLGNYLVEVVARKIEIKNFTIVSPGSKESIDGVLSIEFMPAYNINKFREPGKVFHPKENMGLGFYLKFRKMEDGEDVFVYHTGDTDFIPEMKKQMKVDILMVPVSGIYVMTSAEAAEAVNHLRPNVAIPMHHDGGVVGSPADGDLLTQLAESDVVILEPLTLR